MLRIGDLLSTRTDRIRVAGGPGDSPAPPEAPWEGLLEGEHHHSLEHAFEEWSRAGADILLAPTLRATPSALKPFGLGQRTGEVNRSVLDAVRSAALLTHPSPWVAAQVGPLADSVAAAGHLGFDAAYIQYHEQAKSLALFDPDLILVRRIGDLRVLRAAIVAIRELWMGPVLVLLDPALVAAASPTDCSLEDVLEVVHSLDVQGVGVEGIEDQDEIVESAGAIHSRGFLLTAAVLPGGPRPFAERLRSLARARVNMAIVEGEHGLQDLRSLEGPTASLGTEPPAQGGHPVEAGGEPDEALPTEPPRRIAVAFGVDWTAGAASEGPAAPPGVSLPGARLYVGVEVLESTEELAARGIRRGEVEARLADLERRRGVPLALVVRDPLVLEMGLKAARGRAIAYLDSLDTALWPSVFYLAARYGAKVGIRLAPLAVKPGVRCASGVIQAIGRLLREGSEYTRIAPEDVYVDPLGLASGGEAGWDPESIHVLLRQMPPAKRETGVRWILPGLRFREPGAPESPARQAQLLSLALFQGLDAVIVGPGQTHLVEAVEGFLR